MRPIQDVNIREFTPLKPPAQVKREMPASNSQLETVIAGRDEVVNCLGGQDNRLLVMVGPCSIHSREVALDYARRLAVLRRELSDRLAIVMRVYFEKPRTTVGWKGLIFDPRLDGSENMQEGIVLARQILLDVIALGLPVATEMLDPIAPQYLAELVSWASIGARTSESQTHREMSSGLSMPVGFKNSTDGNLQVAIDAIQSAQHPHTFLGIDQAGVTCVVRTNGNRWVHLVLRGGKVSGPNYDAEHVAEARQHLAKAELPPMIVVDCSHANSGKQHARQRLVLESVLEQRLAGDASLRGVMLESNIHEGRQNLTANPCDLAYGISVTDECMSWETTESMLRDVHARLARGGVGQVPAHA